MLKGVPVHSRRNHDIRACTHPREQPGEVIGGFRFRDVDHMISRAMIYSVIPGVEISFRKRQSAFALYATESAGVPRTHA
jgi:hypothetical protein